MTTKRAGRLGVGFIAAFALLALVAGTGRAESNDYPTATRADYVIGCMAANGNTREALLKCSCAIDTIAGLMPYSRYEQAETVASFAYCATRNPFFGVNVNATIQLRG